MTIAEDMSYNHGPMISRRICDQFMTPYYLRLLERVKEMNILTIMDSDGDVTKLVPWLQSVGVEGVLPLERQAKVDGMALRQAYPTLRMVGHYNKLVMHLGEAAMREEFERLAAHHAHRRLHPQRRPPDPARGFDRRLPALSATARGIHRRSDRHPASPVAPSPDRCNGLQTRK